MNKEELEMTKAFQRKQLEYAHEEMKTDKWDILILDEIMAAITENMISVDDVLALIRNKPEKLEIVLTGRNAPERLIEVADYVSDIREVKHPIQKGVAARRGIED
jgi:cob(I)alamin adenosyltransferase